MKKTRKKIKFPPSIGDGRLSIDAIDMGEKREKVFFLFEILATTTQSAT